MKILCVGEALIDMICTDKGTSLADGLHFLKKSGGAPTNVAAAIASLGGEVELMAKVGLDPFGDQLVREMEAFGVNTQFILRDETYFTTLAFVSLMENGERDFVFNRGADANLSKLDIINFNIKHCNIIHFGSATAFLDGPLRDTYYHLLEEAKKSGVFISFDPNYRHLLFKDKIDAFIHHCWNFIQVSDFFKVSDEEAMLLTGKSNLDEAIQALKDKTSCHFAITQGKQGTTFRHGENIRNVDSISVQPVDTTGAGDAFVGAVLYQLNSKYSEKLKFLELDDWLRIIKNANKAGARTCEYLGAMEAFKNLNNAIFSD